MKGLIKGFAVAAMMLASATVTADTSYLYWMTEGLGSGPSSWSYAKVAYTDGKTTGYLAPGDEETFAAARAVGGEFFGEQVSIGSLVLNSSYKFALELFNDNYDKVGGSSWIAYAASFIGGESFSGSEAVFSGFAVPEPTSGMLALLGFALLGLRRKQKNA